MGFSKQDYEDYIASPAWEAKRQRALRKHGAKCAACGSSEQLHVHHHTYERFRRERMADLVILCQSCHRVVHRLHNQQRFAKGPTLTLTEVTFAFLRHGDPRAYSSVVMADHTPPVPPKAPRMDGKREVDLSRAARGARPGSGKSMSGKALRARAAERKKRQN